MKASLVLLALAVIPATSLAGSSLKSQVEAMNKPIDAAFKKKDIAAFTRVVKGGMTPDFKYIDDGSKPMDYDHMVAGMKQAFAVYQKITKVETSVLSVKEKGNAGTAVERHTMEGLVAGPDKKPHKMVFVGTSTETFRKVHGMWLMASMSMKTDKMTMDGKPMSMR